MTFEGRKNVYTIIDPTTNEVIANDTSYTRMYYQVMRTLCTEDNLGKRLRIFKNRTADDPGELVYELISVQDATGRIHLNNSVALERIRQRHEERLQRVAGAARRGNAPGNEGPRPSVPRADDAKTKFKEIIAQALNRQITHVKNRFWMEDTPWKKPYQEGTYILRDDYEVVSPYIGEGELSIRKNVLPQPYIGNPEARVWLLPRNPSYSEMDVYDMVSCGYEDKMAVLKSILGHDPSDGEFRQLQELFMRDDKTDLEKRGELMKKQLSFASTDFYVLAPEFHTIKKEVNKFRRRVPPCSGSFEWWNHYFLSCEKSICRLIGNDLENEEKRRKILEKFFVLESFPYHSEKFDKSLYFYQEAVSKVKHYPFWKKMIEYALQEDKILLCRGKDIAGRVSEIARKIGKGDADNNQIFVSTSSGSFYVSTGNFISYAAAKSKND